MEGARDTLLHLPAIAWRIPGRARCNTWRSAPVRGPRSINFLSGLVGIRSESPLARSSMPSMSAITTLYSFRDLRISDLNLSTSPRLIVHRRFRNVLASRPNFSSSGRAEARRST